MRASRVGVWVLAFTAAAAARAQTVTIALKLHQALTAGRESAWLYWQLTDGDPGAEQTLTDATARAGAPKYVAVKHYFRHIRPGAASDGGGAGAHAAVGSCGCAASGAGAGAAVVVIVLLPAVGRRRRRG
ncbi:MAG TPA: MYXO-CTERM sorting domain-containing protein [Polyangia bacterium]|jgi:uncharacterized protein (TIGR03382 family)